MGTRELPVNPPRMMDENQLALLIRDAMAAFNDFIRGKPFEIEAIDVYRAQPSGLSHQRLSRPKLEDAVSLYQSERADLPAAKALLDYLWEYGGHRLTITRKDGDPDRADWGLYAFREIVVGPLWRLWHEHSVRRLSSAGKWDPWAVPEHDLDRAAKELASYEVGNGAPVVVTIPLLQLELADLTEFELEHGVSLHAWSEEDRAVYLYKNEGYYPRDDIYGRFVSKCYVRIVANYKDVLDERQTEEPAQALEDFVGTILARIKWAIMQATTSTRLIRELPATIEGLYSPWGFSPIRRQGIRRDLQIAVTLDEPSCQFVRKLLSMFKSALNAFPDFRDVMWMFDRATLATLPRDILLESTIGLERLLVEGSGENTRRFKTYGAALTADGNPEAVSRDLAEIYALRSKAAHGGDVHPEQFKKFAIAARTYLVRAIANTVFLVGASKVQPTAKKRLNKAIEGYLMSLMYAGARKDLEGGENPNKS